VNALGRQLLRGFRKWLGHPGGASSVTTSGLIRSDHEADAGFAKRDVAKRQQWRELLVSTGEADRLGHLKDIHKGRRAFIIGNGPSLKQQDLTKLSKEVTFVTNWFANHDQYDLVKPSYYCISSHEVFGGWSAKPPQLNGDLRSAIELRNWKSHHFFPIWARDAVLSDPTFARERTNFLIFERPKAEISKRGAMSWDVFRNLDDGYTGIVTFCLPLAYHMGIREVYLLGCDCDYQIKSATDAKAYFYDFAKHSTSTSKFETLDRIWGPGGEIFDVYAVAKRSGEALGMKIFNATEGGLLEVFDRASYEHLVRS
jgi:hypothetical protein